ncbi:hypothetical protein ACLB2K_076997 [Fragaria x ananassa]
MGGGPKNPPLLSVSSGFNPSTAASGSAPAKAKWAKNKNQKKKQRQKLKKAEQASKDIATESIPPVALAPEINDTDAKAAREAAALKKKQENRQRQKLKKAEEAKTKNIEQGDSGLRKPDSSVSHDATEASKDITTSSIESEPVALARRLMTPIVLNNFQEELKEAEIDALCDQLGEEISKQLTGLTNFFVSKDFQVIIEEMVKKELADVGQAVVRLITPAIEKCQATIDLAISNYFQKGDGYEAFNQLEKSVNSKLEATVPEQIKAQFQTSGEQALRCDGRDESMECFKDEEASSSASSATQTLSGELADDHHKLLALAAGRESQVQ